MSEILITQRDQGRTVKAEQGDVIVVSLEENLTTGYQWEVGAIDSSVLELLDSTYSPDAGTLLGRGGMRTLRLRAKAPGRAPIQLRLRRSWDPADVATAHLDVKIRVR